MLENIERTWSRHCYGQGHCVTPLSNIAVLATNVIKMTEWPRGLLEAAGDSFAIRADPVFAGGLPTRSRERLCRWRDREPFYMQPLDFVLERFALDLGALQHGVGMAECIPASAAFERLWNRDVVGRSVAWTMGYSIGLG